MKILWFFVEGETDEEFLQRVIVPRLNPQFYVRWWRYARKPKEDRRKFIQALHSPSFSQTAEYWILADKDQCACFSACRDAVIMAFDGLPHRERIICPDRSIEVWYVAGFTSSDLFRRLEFPIVEGLHKNQFDQIIQGCGYTMTQRSEILASMLDGYNLDLARQRSPSLDYFCRKLGI